MRVPHVDSISCDKLFTFEASVMQVDFLNPPELCPTTGWTHIAAVSGGKTIYISGQVAVDARGELVGPGGVRREPLRLAGHLV